MLPKKNRIKKEKDFETVFKNSKSLRNDLIVFKITNNKAETNRFGFVVSKKISKSAVVRNRVKRRLAEAIRSMIGGMKKGVDLVLIALPGIEKENFSEVKKAVEEALTKAKLVATIKK